MLEPLAKRLIGKCFGLDAVYSSKQEITKIAMKRVGDD